MAKSYKFLSEFDAEACLRCLVCHTVVVWLPMGAGYLSRREIRIGADRAARPSAA